MLQLEKQGGNSKHVLKDWVVVLYLLPGHTGWPFRGQCRRLVWPRRRLESFRAGRQPQVEDPDIGKKGFDWINWNFRLFLGWGCNPRSSQRDGGL